MKIRSLMGAAALALTVGCSDAQLDSKKYVGNLPGYGLTEITVYTWKGSEEIASVQFRTEMDRNMFELNDGNKDGKLQFTHGRVIGEGHLYPGKSDFKSADDTARYLLGLRGTRMEEVKSPPQN